VSSGRKVADSSVWARTLIVRKQQRRIAWNRAMGS
jgi:hypothetical protein